MSETQHQLRSSALGLGRLGPSLLSSLKGIGTGSSDLQNPSALMRAGLGGRAGAGKVLLPGVLVQHSDSGRQEEAIRVGGGEGTCVSRRRQRITLLWRMVRG